MSTELKPEPVVFDNLGDAFKFVDTDLQNVIKLLKLYHHHMTELMAQLAQKAAAGDAENQK